ncbi:MAG: ribosomal protein S18-alanine N-acetyltransferase [Candidatus Latescibacteria bacterium]|nr:ribosomal protein S18-alanine N-acetyltransferase [Candidatus Latescibacterota bacterium]
MGCAAAMAEGTALAPTRFALLQGEDLGAVRAIEQMSFANPWSVEELGWLVQEEEGLCLGVWVGDELIGYGLGQVAEGCFHLASLATAPAWRRQGWGGRLLQELLGWAGQRGCRACRLEVRTSNRAALSLYRNWGFREVGRLERFYTRPVEDGLVMHRELS